MTTALNAIAFKARTHSRHRLQNLYGQLNADALYRAWANLNKQSAAGIDGVTASDFGQAKSTKWSKKLYVVWDEGDAKIFWYPTHASE